MKDLITVAKALSDENRVRSILALRKGELCACQIIELLNLAPSTVSKHLSILRQAGLVECRKEERWMYYRLPRHLGANAMRQRALDWVFESLAGRELSAVDSKRLSRILAIDREVLCRKRLGRVPGYRGKTI
jgi:ArsR family transcriptional regulator